MKNLTHYIDNRNTWNSFFPNSKTITFPLDQKTVDSLARSLDSDLSPENLHCDEAIVPSMRIPQCKRSRLQRPSRSAANYAHSVCPY